MKSATKSKLKVLSVRIPTQCDKIIFATFRRKFKAKVYQYNKDAIIFKNDFRSNRGKLLEILIGVHRQKDDDWDITVTEDLPSTC